jgi:fatty acid desaturase
MKNLLFIPLSGVPVIDDEPVDYAGELVTYRKFKARLSINVPVLLFNLLLPWVMITFSLFIFYLCGSGLSGYILIPFLAIYQSYWLHAYTCHFHEAAHYNLHKNKKINDLLALFILTPFVGMFVQHYRVTHWEHHRYLGGLMDTEVSYRNPINKKFFMEGLSGFSIIRILLRYSKNFSNTNHKKKSNFAHYFMASLAIYFSCQFLIIILLYKFISLPAVISWLLTIFLVYPLISQLRQMLEHRSFAASCDEDYRFTEHGPINRMFGNDFFSRYFGSAGFNSHFLHHLDPSISYTSFSEMEAFLLSTKASVYLKANRTSYFKCFKRLISQ